MDANEFEVLKGLLFFFGSIFLIGGLAALSGWFVRGKDKNEEE